MDTGGPGSLHTSTSIILIGRDDATIHALRLFLESHMHLSVVGYKSMSGYLALQSHDQAARIVIVDADALNGDTATLLSRLRIVIPVSSVIVLSANADMAAIATDAGADEFISKSDPPKRLVTAVERLRIRGEDAQ